MYMMLCCGVKTASCWLVHDMDMMLCCEGKNGIILSSIKDYKYNVFIVFASTVDGYDTVLWGKNGIMLSSTLHEYQRYCLEG